MTLGQVSSAEPRRKIRRLPTLDRAILKAYRNCRFEPRDIIEVCPSCFPILKPVAFGINQRHDSGWFGGVHHVETSSLVPPGKHWRADHGEPAPRIGRRGPEVRLEDCGRV